MIELKQGDFPPIDVPKGLTVFYKNNEPISINVLTVEFRCDGFIFKKTYTQDRALQLVKKKFQIGDIVPDDIFNSILEDFKKTFPVFKIVF